MLNLCLVVASLLSLAAGLHLPLHLEDATAPVDNNLELNQTQLQFNQQFTRITEQVDYVSRTLDLNDSQKYDFLIQRCKEITSGLNLLKRSLLKYNLLIVSKDRSCPGITTFNRSQINRYVTYTEEKERQMSQWYAKCIDCQFIIGDIDKMIDLTRDYFTVINNTLDGDYCPKKLDQKAVGVVDISKSYAKNNLAADNWFYGSTTKSDYKILMFKRSATYNLTSCPIETPFVRFKEQVCFNCPNNNMFNLGTQNCTTCNVNEFFNVVTGSCAECLGKKKVVNHSIVCETCVFSALEFYNRTSGRCQKCEGKSYLDKVDHNCKPINCSSNTPKFNPDSQLCQACPVSEEVDPNDPTKCRKVHYVALCPNETPFYDVSTHSCKACTNGTQFNQKTQNCEANPTPTPKP